MEEFFRSQQMFILSHVTLIDSKIRTAGNGCLTNVVGDVKHQHYTETAFTEIIDDSVSCKEVI